MKWIERADFNGPDCSEGMIVLFGKIELWWHKGSWRRPSEWIFEIEERCANRCISMEIGFFGITLLRNGCVGDKNDRNE